MLWLTRWQTLKHIGRVYSFDNGKTWRNLGQPKPFNMAAYLADPEVYGPAWQERQHFTILEKRRLADGPPPPVRVPVRPESPSYVTQGATGFVANLYRKMRAQEALAAALPKAALFPEPEPPVLPWWDWLMACLNLWMALCYDVVMHAVSGSSGPSSGPWYLTPLFCLVFVVLVVTVTHGLLGFKAPKGEPLLHSCCVLPGRERGGGVG